MPLAGPLEYEREDFRKTYLKKTEIPTEGWRQETDAEYKARTDKLLEKLEAKQPKRNPNWKPGDPLLVHWTDVAELTGAVARPGDF